MKVKWYCGPITPAVRGYFKYGPFPSRMAMDPYVKEGFVLTAYDDDNKIAAFEFCMKPVTNGIPATVNPFGAARYWRACCNTFMEIERIKETEIVVERDDPIRAAEQYRKFAEMHPNFMWATYLHDAAFYIEKLARMVYDGLEPPAPVAKPFTVRSRLPTVISEVKPPAPRSRRAAMPPPVTSETTLFEPAPVPRSRRPFVRR